MEKTQDAEPKEEVKKKEKVVGSVGGVTINSPEFMDAMKKMKAVTPPAVASQFNLKTSVAKRMLEDAEAAGKVQLVAHTNNLRVYSLAKAN